MDTSAYEDITPRGLKSKLDAGERPMLLDVREPWEFELARIEGSRRSDLPNSTPTLRAW